VIRLGFVANPFSLPFTLALERGYFVAAGLDVEVERFANGSAASAALADGTIEVGVSGHLQTLLIGSGEARQVFLAPLGFEASPDHLPITLIARDGIAGAPGLEGQSIAVSALGAISELQLRIFMHEAGADYDSVRLVAMPFREMGEAFASGSVGAASVPEPFASVLTGEGVGRIIDRGSLSSGLKPGQRAMIAGVASKADWAAADPGGVRGIADAIGLAIDDLAADPTLGVSMMAGQIGGNVDTSLMQAPLFDRHLDVADLQRVFDLAHAHGLLPSSPDAGPLIN
jgi:NitT/TauT family transport system substrate-binding protein